MIKRIKLDNRILSDQTDLYALFYTVGGSFDFELRVAKEYISEGYVDIYRLVKDHNLLDGTEVRYHIAFEVRDYLFESLVIGDINKAKDEVLFDFSKDEGKAFSKTAERFSDYRTTPLYVTASQRSLIVNVSVLENRRIVCVLNQRNPSLFRSEDADLYYLLFETDITAFEFVLEDSMQPTVRLRGHRRENLSNYSYTGKTSKSETKLYEDLNSTFENFTTQDYLNVRNEINYSFSSFDKHVRFGSAYSKVTNAVDKIERIEVLQNEIDNASGYSEASVSALRGKIRDLIDGFTLYERHVYNNVYKQKTPSEFEGWVEAESDKAELYDLQNEEFILYLMPPDIIETDEVGYFTNFVLLMGEFFDNIWLYIEALSNVKEKNFYSEYQISSGFVDDALREMGLDKEVKFTEADLTEYFTGTENLKGVSEIISRRLLYNLPFLYKSKGTVSVVKQVLNIFGVPDGILDVYEFGSVKKDISAPVYNNDYEFYLGKQADDVLSLDVGSSSFASDASVEFVVNNFDAQDGNLIRFNADTSIDYAFSGSQFRLEVTNGGSMVYSSSYGFNDNDNWTYIGITKGADNSGSVYLWEQDPTGYGITNGFSASFDWGAGLGSFSEVELLSGSALSITEFRVFGSLLDSDEAQSHAEDVRSVAEKEYPETLDCRVKFYKPDSGSASLDAVEGDYTLTMTGVTQDDFGIDEFFNYSYIKYIPSEDMHSNKVRLEDKANSPSSLARSSRFTDYEFDEFPDDPNVLGVFISPTDKLNTAVVRRIGDFVELIPDDQETKDYSFTTLDENRKYLSEIPDTYSNLYIYHSLLKLFNRRIFSILRDFVPATTQLQYGLLVKNHILSKVRGYKHTKESEYYRNIVIREDARRTLVDSQQRGYHEITPIGAERTSRQYMDKVNLYDDHRISMRSDDSTVSTSIRNRTSTIKSDFYTKRLIFGARPLPPDSEEVDILKNAGASILVV